MTNQVAKEIIDRHLRLIELKPKMRRSFLNSEISFALFGASVLAVVCGILLRLALEVLP